ncbi:MAG: Crp/Fnr family transcriptional regulator [Pseudomonadota bacterium]
MRNPEAKRGGPHEAEMSEEVIEILRQHGTRRAFKKKQLVVSIGDDFDNLFLIDSGRFSYSIMNAQGDVYIYGYKAAGSTWGLTASLTGKPAAFSFEAVEDSVLTSVHRNVLWSLIDTDPVVRHGHILGLGWAVRKAIAVGHEHMTLSLPQRIANFLLDNADSEGNVELSQSVFARNLGVSRYALGNQLQTLKRRALIEIAYGRVKVINPTQLAQLGLPS